MKQTQADKAAYERMKPGQITAAGFLGPDKRPVSGIIESDTEEMLRLGLDFETTADSLARLRDEGSRGLGEPVTTNGGILVKSGDARGVLPCPWSDGVFHKNSVEAVNEKTGARIIYSDLSIHLLRAHSFCQGKDSDFRLDPKTLQELFGK